MTRPVLSSEKLAPGVATYIAAYHQKTVSEVASAVATNKIVVVGMGINPFVKKARAALSEAGMDFKYLEYGNYFSLWKPRLAIKMWSGWPTFPQVFVDGKLIGGFKETVAALKSGSITN
jgi:glutaredoxin-related protein